MDKQPEFPESGMLKKKKKKKTYDYNNIYTFNNIPERQKGPNPFIISTIQEKQKTV